MHCSGRFCCQGKTAGGWAIGFLMQLMLDDQADIVRDLLLASSLEGLIMVVQTEPRPLS